MNGKYLSPLLLLALAACADTGLEPAAPAGSLEVGPASLSQAQAPETTGDHLIVFKGNSVPSGFAAEVEALGGTVVRSYERVGAMLVAGMDDAGLDALRGHRSVQIVEPEPWIELPEPALGQEVELAEVGIESPDDPTTAYFFARQWHLRAIGADQAWAAGHLGSEEVLVSILDTGIDYTYPDLVGRVDLDKSISLRPEDDWYVQNFFPGRHLISDIGYHGTHVASTVVSNGYVNAGVTSKTTLMGVKVCSVAAGGCRYIFDAIEYSVDQGADIINMSLGGAFAKKDYPGYVSVINRYASYAAKNGTLIVVSAGNEQIDMDHSIMWLDGPDADGDGEPDYEYRGRVPSLYKTYCDAPNVLCVSATGPTSRQSINGPWENVDAPAVYTNYGRSAVNVAAPGGNTGGAVYAACSQTSLVYAICRTGNYVLGINGTSMAAPHASGVAALLVAEMGHGNPAQIRTAVEQSADDLGQPGTDPFYGKGRINAARAVGVQ